jgi:hypothetical protein
MSPQTEQHFNTKKENASLFLNSGGDDGQFSACQAD